MCAAVCICDCVRMCSWIFICVKVKVRFICVFGVCS